MNAGCLLMVGENEGRVLAARLRAGGIGVVRVETNTGIQEAALDGLRCARGKERTMIAASGEKVWAALALAARMNIDRLALINPCPAECAETRKMQFFAMRNLFFCVSDVIVIERGDGRAFDRTVKRLSNSRVWRMTGATEAEIMDWTEEFLKCADFSECEGQISARQA